MTPDDPRRPTLAELDRAEPVVVTDLDEWAEEYEQRWEAA